MPSTTFHAAAAADLDDVRDLLRSAGLPASDVGQDRQEFLLAREGERLVGTVGIEVHGRDGLLRSLAVVDGRRGQGLGGALYERAVGLAALRGVRTLYLLTTTAEKFFAARGFDRVDRQAAPNALRETPEFASLCPATAACMRRELAGQVRHYPADLLPLRPDVPGAARWAVALDRTMLTYFEIAPGGRFPGHRHEAEQITLVLEGELWFDLGDREVRVGPGEVLAIPSNAWHATRAGPTAVRAVDAWSPPRPEYLAPA
jgi:amino-acid N-acetyltransferase